MMLYPWLICQGSLFGAFLTWKIWPCRALALFPLLATFACIHNGGTTFQKAETFSQIAALACFWCLLVITPSEGKKCYRWS